MNVKSESGRRHSLLMLALVITAMVSTNVQAQLATEVKETLAERGYYQGSVDNTFNEELSNSVKLFQSENGLPETGRLDRGTLQALGIESLSNQTSAEQAGTANEVESNSPSMEVGDTEIIFQSPQDGSRVGSPVDVVWQYSGLPADTLSWIVVIPEAVPNLHPQGAPIRLRSGAGVERGLAYIGDGSRSRTNELFHILVVAVSAQGSAEFGEYLRRANQRRDWPGMYTLPSGSRELARITVRK